MGVLGGFRLRVQPVADGLIADTVTAAVTAQGPTPRPTKGPHKDALWISAWYLAGVICDYNGHDATGDWPCKQCMGRATEEVHQLATTKITVSKAREVNGKVRKKPEAKARKAGSRPGKRAGRNAGR